MELWRCDQMRAGVLYQRQVFNTEAEAKRFAAKRLEIEPDTTFEVRALPAMELWN